MRVVNYLESPFLTSTYTHTRAHKQENTRTHQYTHLEDSKRTLKQNKAHTQTQTHQFTDEKKQKIQ